MKNIFLPVCLLAVTALCACKAEYPPDYSSISPTEIVIEIGEGFEGVEIELGNNNTVTEEVSEITPDPGPHVNPYGEVTTEFVLSSEEQALYDEFKANLDINIFKDIAPASIAKVFVQCGIEGNWEAEYELYSKEGFYILNDDDEEVYFTKEDWQFFSDKDIRESQLITRKDRADIVLPLLGEAEFVDNGENLGYLTFISTDPEKTMYHFVFVKNENGVWQPRYAGIYPVAAE